MKKMIALLSVLCLLSACGNAGQSSAAAPDVLSQSLAVPAAAPASPPVRSPNPSPAPPTTPSPTPAPPPSSLREVLTPGPQLWADGQAVACFTLDGVAYVQDTVLSAVYPWLTRQIYEGAVCYTARDGSYFSVDFLFTTGRLLPTPEDGQGICLLGETKEYWLPLRSFCRQAGLYLLWDEVSSSIYVCSPLATSLLPQKVTVPVLMYHEVGDDLWGIESLFVRPDNMRAQLQYLWENGYNPIFFSDLWHLSDYDKPVLLTFDDGYIGNYTELFPLLKEYNMKATIFAVTESLNTENRLTDDNVREMVESGLVEVQSHTAGHYELATLTAQEQEYQIAKSQLDLARITKRIPYVLSYPCGSHNKTTVSIAQNYYTFGIKMNGGKWTIGNDYFHVPRLYVARSTTLSAFAAMLS